jgi:hypothetical protein
MVNASGPLMTMPVRIQVGDTEPCAAGWVELDSGDPSAVRAALASFLRGVADYLDQPQGGDTDAAP